MGAASTWSTWPTTTSTSSPRAATRPARISPSSGSGATTSTTCDGDGVAAGCPRAPGRSGRGRLGVHALAGKPDGRPGGRGAAPDPDLAGDDGRHDAPGAGAGQPRTRDRI